MHLSLAQDSEDDIYPASQSIDAKPRHPSLASDADEKNGDRIHLRAVRNSGRESAVKEGTSLSGLSWSTAPEHYNGSNGWAEV